MTKKKNEVAYKKKSFSQVELIIDAKGHCVNDLHDGDFN